jgi:protein-S-isoprenylcysteine O-methyltransferase Ste14
MIDNKFIKFIEKKFKSNIRYYRIFYNITATISLIPIMIFAHTLPKLIYFQWDGYFIILQVFFILISLVIFVAGSRNYDFLQLIGIQQIINKSEHKSLSKSGKLNTEGILGLTRHPWYTAFFILLWARELNSASLIVNIIFSIYLVVGTYLEEQKLKIEFGESYVKYQKNVSMLLPIKWIKSTFKEY